MSEWYNKYVGKQYVVGAYDCCHLVSEVYEQELGQELELPTERNEGVFMLSRQIKDEKDNYVEQIADNEASDYDIVIMRTNGRALNHVGLYVRINGIPYVLHNTKNIGSVILNKIRELPKVNLQLEGIFRFKNKE